MSSVVVSPARSHVSVRKTHRTRGASGPRLALSLRVYLPASRMPQLRAP